MRILAIASLSILLALLMLQRGATEAARPSTTQTATRTAGQTGNQSLPDPIAYQHIVRDDPPVHVHVVTVDLMDPRVRLRVCRGGADPDGDGPWQTTLRSVREIAEENHLVVAVNGNFFTCKDSRTFAGRKIPYFSGNFAKAMGWAMSDGRLWSAIDAGVCSMVVDSNGHVSFGHFRPNLPPDAREVVSGGELVLADGKVTHVMNQRSPRTAVGLDQEGKTLVMMVVDGRKIDYSAGMNDAELGQAMLEQGCWNALTLDGGGSSTMVMLDPIENVVRVMNRPSDGHDLPISMSLERPVACALGVQIVEKP